MLPMLVFTSCKNQTSPVGSETSSASSHPSLIITEHGVRDIRANLGSIPIFDATLAATKAEIDAEMAMGIDVPIPKDFSGGYTHQKHKTNFLMLQKAGVLYQILDNESYAKYVKDMLFAYAKLYPTLPPHPQVRSYARGKLFWQALNDANWLVYASQAYDCVYNYLTEEERNILEKDLFRPFADYISKESPQFFNRVHNHSTWGNVAVGMIALVMEDDALLKTALHGLQTDNLTPDMKDNDGGFIKNKDGKAGFLANIEEPFSPDGYYTEGPYYQRYAMYPFLILAQALQNKKPALNIFQYKDSILLKAVDALINLSDADGEFFALNDAQKGMSYFTSSLVSAVDIAYHFGGNNPELLSIAQKQAQVTLDDAGLAVALAIKNGKAVPYQKNSIELSDGPNGDEGAVGILRRDNIELVFKYTAHGLSHGHYDKLSFLLFDEGKEVVQDYGMARFVNIEQKGGGNYLKENTTWAKQTVAHNTLVQNETSHFKGEYEVGSKHHSEKYIFDVKNKDVQVASAKEQNAYPGTEMHRTMVLIKDANYPNPFVLDILRVSSDKANQYDLPLYYLGHIMQTSFEYSKLETPTILGKSDGYQHLFKEAQAESNGKLLQFTWLLNNKFYTYSAVTSNNDEIILARIGANDPEYNLRNDPSLIIRKKNAKNAFFVSVIESHGYYSPVDEMAVNAYSNIAALEILHSDDKYTLVTFGDKVGHTYTLALANEDPSEETGHQIDVKGMRYEWVGPWKLIK